LNTKNKIKMLLSHSLSLPKISPAKLSLVIYWLHPKVMKVVTFHFGFGIVVPDVGVLRWVGGDGRNQMC
jgi:hypothetical protein